MDFEPGSICVQSACTHGGVGIKKNPRHGGNHSLRGKISLSLGQSSLLMGAKKDSCGRCTRGSGQTPLPYWRYKREAVPLMDRLYDEGQAFAFAALSSSCKRKYAALAECLQGISPDTPVYKDKRALVDTQQEQKQTVVVTWITKQSQQLVFQSIM